MPSPQRPLTEGAPDSNSRNSPSTMSSSPFYSSPFNSFSSLPVNNSQSLRHYWLGRESSPPKTSDGHSPNRAGADGPQPHSLKKSSIENLRRASCVRNSYFTQHAPEYDDGHTTSDFSRSLAGGAWDNNSPTRPSQYRSNDEYVARPQTSPGETSAANQHDTSLVNSPPLLSDEPQITPPKSSLRRRTMPSRNDAFSSEDDVTTPRRPKSVSFDDAPPQINEYERTTPDPASSTSSGSHAGSDSEDDFDFYEHRRSQVPDDDEDFHDHNPLEDTEDTEDTEHTPAVHPDRWQSRHHEINEDDETSPREDDDDPFTVPSYNQTIQEEKQETNEDTESSQDNRPLPTPPAHQSDNEYNINANETEKPSQPAAAKVTLTHRILSPQLRSGLPPNTDNNDNQETVISEDRLRWMRMRDSREEARKQRERRLRRSAHNKDGGNRRSLHGLKKEGTSDSTSDITSSSPSVQSQSPLRDITNSKNGERPSSSPPESAKAHDASATTDREATKQPLPRFPPRETTLRDIRDEVTRHIPLASSAATAQSPERKSEPIEQSPPSHDLPLSPPNPSVEEASFDKITLDDRVMRSSPPLEDDIPLHKNVSNMSSYQEPIRRDSGASEANTESFQTPQKYLNTHTHSRIPQPTSKNANSMRYGDYKGNHSHSEEIRRKPVPEIVSEINTIEPAGKAYDDGSDESDTGSVLRMPAENESYAPEKSYLNDHRPIESIEHDSDDMRHDYVGHKHVMETVEEDDDDDDEENQQRPLPLRPVSRMSQHEEDRAETPDSVIHYSSREASVSESEPAISGYQGSDHEVFHDAQTDRIGEDDEDEESNDEREKSSLRSRDTSYSRDSSPDIDAVPDVVATVKAPGGAFITRPSLTPADVATMAATRRKVSGQGLPSSRRPLASPFESSAVESEKETMPTGLRDQSNVKEEEDREREEIKDDLIEEEEEDEKEDDGEEFHEEQDLEEEATDRPQARSSERVTSSSFKLDVPVNDEGGNGLLDVEQEFGRLFQTSDNPHTMATADEILSADEGTNTNGPPERRQSGQVFMTPSGYLMRQNTKVVVASSRLSEDGNPGPSDSRPSRRPSQQAWVTEPSKHRRSSLRSSGLSVTSSMRRKSSQGGPRSSMGRDSLGITDLEPLEEEYADGEERGRLFVKVIGVRELDLPLPDDDRFQFALTLDNGMHCVTTSWLDLYRTSAIGQEFELMVFNDLEFQLTLQMKIDPPPAKPSDSRRSPSPSGRSTLKSQRMSTLSRVFASPKKRREQQQQEVEAKIQEEEQSRQADKQAAAAITQDPFRKVRPLVAEDGSFARAYVSLSEFQDMAYGRPHIASLASFNEWATEPVAETSNDSTVASKSSKRTMKMMMGSTSSSKSNNTVTKISMRRCPPYQIGILDLQMLFVPKPKNASEEEMPSSMAVAIKDMKEAEAPRPPPAPSFVPSSAPAINVTWEGFLSHQPDDNPFRRRRCYFRLEGLHLRAYYETTRETRIINLANATKLIGTHEESSGRNGERASFDGEEDFMFFEKGFQIKFRSGEVINFYADNTQDKEDWVRVLGQVVGKKINTQSQVPPAPQAPLKKWTAMVLRHERANNGNRQPEPVQERIPVDAHVASQRELPLPSKSSSAPGPAMSSFGAPSPMLSKGGGNQHPSSDHLPPAQPFNAQPQQHRQSPASAPAQSPVPSMRSPRPPSAAQRRLPQPPLKQERPLPLPQSPPQRPLPSPMPGQANGFQHRIPTSPPTAAARPLPQPRPQSRQYYSTMTPGMGGERDPGNTPDLRFNSHSHVQQHHQQRQPPRHPRPNIPSSLIPAASPADDPPSPIKTQPPTQHRMSTHQEMVMPYKAQTMRDHRSMPPMSAPQQRRTMTGPSSSSSSSSSAGTPGTGSNAGSSNRHSQFFHSFKLPGMHKKTKSTSEQ